LAHAEESAKAQDRVGHLAADLVDHQPLDMADAIAVWPAHRGAFDAVACNQLVWFGQDIRHLHHPLRFDEAR
jgi:hypothetical protein